MSRPGLRASAPGKLLLAGEYAILDGGPAVVTAVDRRVIARADLDAAPALSPFLAAAADEIARASGDGPAARAARRITVDSSALYDDGDGGGDGRTTKLGLGSSAAATVAAIACALAHEPAPDGGATPDRDEIHRLAAAAHAHAQGLRGARGSGADIAASTYGGVLALGAGLRPLAVPRRVTLVPFWTGAAADTVALVSAVAAARAARPGPVDAALAAIARAAAALIDALDGDDATGIVTAIDAGGDAVDALGRAAGLDLLTDRVRRVRAALAPLGGSAKTCGAGGGDVAIVALPAAADVTRARAAIVECGCTPLGISVGAPGVDIARPPE